jgi:hypothetical protein
MIQCSAHAHNVAAAARARKRTLTLAFFKDFRAAHMKSPHPRPPALTPINTNVAHTGAGPLHCGFCERSDLEVRRMWAGAHALICNDCIRFMSELIETLELEDEMLDATDDA